MKKLSHTKLLFAALIASIGFTSCSDPESPGYEYMPDMYRTPALEPYAGNSNYPDSMEARLPAEGSIPRGYLPYGIPNTNDGYELAGATLKNPLKPTEDLMKESKEIYTKYCQHCHGENGEGDGPTVTAGGHPPPPAYNSAGLVNLPEGKMFHTITYGKNLMGPHASQLTVEERWKVILYVQELQGGGAEEEGETAEGESNESMSDTTAMSN